MSKKKDRRKIDRAICIFLFTMFTIVSAKFLITDVLYPIRYNNIVEKYAQKYKLPPALIYSVIHTESRFRPNAQSHKNAKGLMQITEPTAAWAADEIGIVDFDLDKIFDPDINIQIGCWYLNKLQAQFNGNRKLMLAAYNAGPGNAVKWLNDKKYSADSKNLDTIPFGETKRYVEKIEKNVKIYSFLLKAYS